MPWKSPEHLMYLKFKSCVQGFLKMTIVKMVNKHQFTNLICPKITLSQKGLARKETASMNKWNHILTVFCSLLVISSFQICT